MLKVFIWPGFLLLILAQWLVPMQMIWQKDKVLDNGTSYKFQTAPVDPGDPFIGKYIMLNFKENSFKLKDTKKLSYNSSVYVSFSADKNGFAKIKSIDISKPQNTDFLETTINYISAEKDSSAIFVNYPFSKFYMEESKAPKAEKIYGERNSDHSLKVYALVKIYNGDAVIKNVFINDSLITDVINARNKVR